MAIVATGRTAPQMQADHQTTDACIIAARIGQWLIKVEGPVGQYVRGHELFCVPGCEVASLRSDGAFFIQYGHEKDAVYDYEGTICDLNDKTERLTFTMTLVDPTGRAVARYEQVRAPKRTHTVESARADYERKKQIAKERLPLAA